MPEEQIPDQQVLHVQGANLDVLEFEEGEFIDGKWRRFYRKEVFIFDFMKGSL